jgi:F-type H+-transporting ATPase subunit b
VLINWFTVAAQAVNFVILVWLLQHFLYQPMLAAIDAREHKIAAALADAAAGQAAAQKSRDELSGKLKAFDDDQAARLAQVVLQVNAQREHLLDAARGEAAELVAKQRSTLGADSAALTDHMAQLVTAEVFSIAGKALGDLASAGLEERLGAVFTRELHQMNAESKAAFGAALRQSAMNARVRSRVALPDGEKAALRNAVNETFAADVHLEFEIVESGESGIELLAGGQRLAWGIHEYIQAFQEKARALMVMAAAS